MRFEVYQGTEPSAPEFTDSVDADDVEEAAEKYAERQYNGGDPFDSIDLIVVDTDGKSWIVSVEAEYSVDFHARVPL